MIINPYAVTAGGGGGGGDPFFANVGLLLHMNALPVSGNIIDSSINNFTCPLTTDTGGGVTLNTTDQQVGFGCLDMASTAGGTTSGSFVTVPITLGGPLDGSGVDYTVEIWNYERGGGAWIPLSIGFTSPGVTLDGVSANVFPFFEGTNIGSCAAPNGQWNHIAMVMSSNSASLYVNGVLMQGPTPVTRNSWGSGNSWQIGGSTFGSGMPGMQQEFRFTKGVARYSGSSFTPPSAPFPNS